MGPLAGVRILEFAGIGPGPMTAMLLADLGADVVRLERLEPSGLGTPKPRRFDLLLRGRRSLAIDLKAPDGVELALKMIERADATIEGFRPGTMERIGLGPDVALARNPRLVYGRMTGWGQDGPLALSAGHDLNYIALTGALSSIGRFGEKPVAPLNLVGDFGGGALYLAFGIVCALLETSKSSKGQVVDAAIVDGAANLMTSFYGLHAAGIYNLERGTNVLDGGDPIYDVYRCSDGRYVSIAPIEKKFQHELFRLLEIQPTGDKKELRRRLEACFQSQPRHHWCELLENTDACFAPVLSLAEAYEHPHNKSRHAFVEIDGIVQPRPAPRFSRTIPLDPTPPDAIGEHARALLHDWGVGARDVETLRGRGIIRLET